MVTVLSCKACWQASLKNWHLSDPDQIRTMQELIFVKLVDAVCGCNGACLKPNEGISMKALADLFSTDYGLLSVGVIAFTLGMGVFFYRFFTKKMDEDAAAAARNK